mgnify:CR=1 FL=1
MELCFQPKFSPRAARAIKKSVSQYEAFRGEIRRVDLAKKVAKNNENRYLGAPESCSAGDMNCDGVVRFRIEFREYVDAFDPVKFIGHLLTLFNPVKFIRHL